MMTTEKMIKIIESANKDKREMFFRNFLDKREATEDVGYAVKACAEVLDELSCTCAGDFDLGKIETLGGMARTVRVLSRSLLDLVEHEDSIIFRLEYPNALGGR